MLPGVPRALLVVRMKRSDPAFSVAFFQGEAGVVHPLLIEIDVPPIGSGDPDDLRHGLGQFSKLAFASLQRLLRPLALGEIAYDDDDARLLIELRLNPDCLNAPEQSVTTDDSELLWRSREPSLLQGLYPVPHGGMVVRVEQFENRFANQRRRVVMPEQSDERFVGVHDAASVISEHTVGHVLDQRPVLGLRSAQRFLRPLAFSDVFDPNDVVKRRAQSTAKNRSAEQNIDDRPVFADVAFFELVAGNFPTSEFACELEIGLEIVGMGDRLERESCQFRGTVADDLAEHTVDADETPIERHQRHSNGRFIDCEAKSLLRFLQRPFDALALADVADECLPASVRQDLGARLDWYRCAVLPPQCPFSHLDHAW